MSLRIISSSKKGSALALVLVIFLALSILGIAALMVSVSEVKNTARSESKLKSYLLARSGAQAVAEYMIQNPNDDAKHFIDNANKDWSDESSWNVGDITGSVKFRIENDEDNGYSILYANGKVDGIEQIAKVRLQKTSTGPNSIFDYAIVGKLSIDSKNAASNSKVIGSIGTPDDDPSFFDVLKESTQFQLDGEYVNDNNIQFPQIKIPVDIPEVNIYNNGLVLDGKPDKPLYSGDYLFQQSTDKKYKPNAIYLKNSAIIIPDEQVVHLFLKGGLKCDANGTFIVGNKAKLYIYIDSEEVVTFIGNSGKEGDLACIFLYAPYSKVSFNNADPKLKFSGSIIGEDVILQNQLEFSYNSSLFDEPGGPSLDTTIFGTDFDGYTFVD